MSAPSLQTLIEQKKQIDLASPTQVRVDDEKEIKNQIASNKSPAISEGNLQAGIRVPARGIQEPNAKTMYVILADFRLSKYPKVRQAIEKHTPIVEYSSKFTNLSLEDLQKKGIYTTWFDLTDPEQNKFFRIQCVEDENNPELYIICVYKNGYQRWIEDVKDKAMSTIKDVIPVSIQKLISAMTDSLNFEDAVKEIIGMSYDITKPTCCSAWDALKAALSPKNV